METTTEATKLALAPDETSNETATRTALRTLQGQNVTASPSCVRLV